MPLFNITTIINNSSTTSGGISLATNFYQIPVAVYTVVAEFSFNQEEYSNISITGEAYVLQTGQEFRLYLIKNNDENNILAQSSLITSINPTSFTILKSGATSGTYQLLALATNIGSVGDARINYANLNKS
jgi:hypothetical protein